MPPTSPLHRSAPLRLPLHRPKHEPAARSPLELVRELQALGMRWVDATGPGLSRAGGAGPSDHKAVTIAGQTVMVPIFTRASDHSPYSAHVYERQSSALLLRNGEPVAQLEFPRVPKFYGLSTADGIPYWKLATLHARDVLATTVLQTCIRYGHRHSSCQFCAIGQSLANKTTIAEKTPAQLAEVSRAAVELDGVKHMVLTTGTPNRQDRGASVLAACAQAIKAAVALPIQAQCEPPDDFAWFERLQGAGVDSLGMHLEAVTERVRRAIMPGKAEVSVAQYLEAFAAAVAVFGRGQVSTYLLMGLGDSPEALLAMGEKLIGLGVYPFVVPFVPIRGTPLENHAPPSPALLHSVLAPLADLLARAGLRSADIKAGCGRCGACSSLKSQESLHA